MKQFMDRDFLLSTPTAVTLYRDYAAAMPLVDYHCHIDPKEIWENRQFENLTQIWLGGDHYKWRAMRGNGVPEEFITGGRDSYEKFELYLAERERVNSDIGRIRRLIGAGERALTSKEDKMFENWLGVWRMPFDLIQLAFEKTIDNTGKFSVTYMNSILKRWFEGGVTTVEDVEKGSGSGSGFKGMASSINDDLIAAALAKGFDEMGEDE